MKFKTIFPLIGAAILVFAYWLGGGDFEREPALGVLLIVSVVVALFAFVMGDIIDDDHNESPYPRSIKDEI